MSKLTLDFLLELRDVHRLNGLLGRNTFGARWNWKLTFTFIQVFFIWLSVFGVFLVKLLNQLPFFGGEVLLDAFNYLEQCLFFRFGLWLGHGVGDEWVSFGFEQIDQNLLQVLMILLTLLARYIWDRWIFMVRMFETLIEAVLVIEKAHNLKGIDLCKFSSWDNEGFARFSIHQLLDFNYQLII